MTTKHTFQPFYNCRKHDIKQYLGFFFRFFFRVAMSLFLTIGIEIFGQFAFVFFCSDQQIMFRRNIDESPSPLSVPFDIFLICLKSPLLRPICALLPSHIQRYTRAKVADQRSLFSSSGNISILQTSWISYARELSQNYQVLVYSVAHSS